MSDDDVRVGGAPLGIVKGGTTSSSYDRELRRRAHDAEQRRRHQDELEAERNAANQRPGEVARLGSHSLINQQSPRLVLAYLAADKTVRQYCKSEITMVPVVGRSNEMESMFTLVCPRCVARGVPQGEAQMMVRSSHRKFFIDERKKGIVRVEYSWGLLENVYVHGTVTCQDTIRCDNHNCDFACKIDDSQVIEV